MSGSTPDPGVVVFSYATWSQRYPELANSVGPGPAAMYFNEATFFVSNASACNPIPDVGKRAVILNMVTAHIAKLNASLDGEEPSPLVGRISSASTGSVSVSSEYFASTSALMAWFNSTKYGAAAWAATGYLRTFRYAAGRQPTFDRFANGYPGGFPGFS